MARSRKPFILWSLLGLLVLVAVINAADKRKLVEWIRFYIRSDLLAVNMKLRTENEKLKEDIKELIEQNHRLKKVLASRTLQFSMFNKTAEETWRSENLHLQDPIEGLSEESFLNQQIYRALLAEKKRWDAFQEAHYQDILERTLEPVVVGSQYLTFEDEDNRTRFLEIESALNLHKLLIRDVRLFHDEVQYRQKQIHEDPAYQLYDLKFNLEPFAMESAIADALQQAMSAMGAGIYPQEATEVIERLGGEFIEPIREFSEWLEDPTDSSDFVLYNYNFYVVFGKKLMNYADNLARQSLIPLAPSALSELDFFSRRIEQSFVRLYEAGSRDGIDSMLLDMEVLEQEIR